MSLVVLVRRHGRSVLASDSHERSGPITVPNGKKILDMPTFAIGHTGESVILDVLRAFFENRKRQDYPDLVFTDAVTVFEFALAFRTFAKSTCHLIEEKPAPESAFAHIGQTFLILDKTRGLGWWIDGDLCVTPIESWWAIGSGREIALGALWALNRYDMSADDLAYAAVETACALTHTCALPVVKVVVEYNE